jgi:hypothetical protein
MSDFYVSAPGEVAPPVPPGPKLCDGRDMRMVHNAFLWGYEQAPSLVRSTPAGDRARSAYVGQWMADMDASLHAHHESEDLLLWDKIENRAPACALHVSQMRAQHAVVAEVLERATPLLTEWRATADPAQGEELAAAYEDMLEILEVHLRREVVEVIPVVEKIITADEWDEVGEHSRGAIPIKRMMPQLGMLLANLPIHERHEFWETIPRPIRAMYGVFGKRQYAKQYRTLFPGKPVPETI